MYRFVLGPRWVAGHVAVALAVAVMVSLGFWQLRRLEERRDYNELVEQRSSLPVAGIEEVGDVGVGAAEFRRVRVTGRFDGSEDTLIGYRSLNGVSGHHVVTPLVLVDGTAVLVNRGWVPAHYLEGWPVADAAPSPGVVDVTGVVRAPERRGSFGPRDPDDGELLLVSRVDVERIARQIDAPVRPFWIQLTTPAPAGGIPAPVPVPDLGEGNHLSYAVQWFIFAAGAAGGWLILLRVSARRRALAPATADLEAITVEFRASLPQVLSKGRQGEDPLHGRSAT